MYLVISRWEALPGREAEFDRIGPILSAILRKQEGVLLVEAIKCGNGHIAVHGYRDEATYRAIVDNPNSEFSKALVANDADGIARWVSSDRGHTFPHV